MGELLWAVAAGAILGGLYGAAKALQFKERTGRFPELYELPELFFGKRLTSA